MHLFFWNFLLALNFRIHQRTDLVLHAQFALSFLVQPTILPQFQPDVQTQPLLFLLSFFQLQLQLLQQQQKRSFLLASVVRTHQKKLFQQKKRYRFMKNKNTITSWKYDNQNVPSLSSFSFSPPLLGEASTCEPSLKIQVVPAGLFAIQIGWEPGTGLW